MKFTLIDFEVATRNLSKRALLGCLLFVFSAFSCAQLVHAEGEGKSINDLLQHSGVKDINPKYLPISEEETPKEALADTIQAFTNVISGFAAGVAILFIVVNAGKLIFAVGGSDEITKAKKGITWAFLGLLVVMFAFVIAKTVISLTFSGDFQ